MTPKPPVSPERSDDAPAAMPSHATATTLAVAPNPARRRLLWRSTALAGGLPLALAGCGGGGDDATPAADAAAADTLRQPLGGVDGGGTGRRAFAMVAAVIDSTGPLVVNGTQYDIDGSPVTDGDGQALDPNTVQPGMTCVIEAQPSAGSNPPRAQALSLQLGQQLLGPVDVVDLASSSFSLLGQRVVVNAGTLLDPALGPSPLGVAKLQAGQLLQVWGQLDTAGARIVATRLAPAPAAAAPADTWLVRGVLTVLDRLAGRAAIGSLWLAWPVGGSSPVPDGVAVGQVVRARLASSGSAPASLLALRSDALRLPDQVSAEVEGRVTRLDSPQRFAVDGIEVDASAAAWPAGSTPALALGQRVDVRGRTAAGVLRATSVTPEPDEPVQLEGLISSANASSRRFVLRGVTVQWSATTTFEGGDAKLLTARRRAAVVGRWNADRSLLLARHIHVEA